MLNIMNTLPLFFTLLSLLYFAHAFRFQSVARTNKRSVVPGYTRGAAALRMQADYALIFDCDGVIVETEVCLLLSH